KIICLYYDDICCFEKMRHKIKVYTVNSIVEFYGSFKSLLNEIDTGLFVKCHQGYIINKDKIKGYKDKTLNMEGDLRIPVSRSYNVNVKEMLAERLLS
ncbi:MAG: LytTR family transcriptional regulator, partial [Desulfovibrionales bacterium]|nr:LytTR family transcriptional regulator [Desulfovibrionales bacterium]